MTLSIDRMLAEAVLQEAAPLIPLHRVDEAEARRYNRTLTIDWGTFVPMYYLQKAGLKESCHCFSLFFLIMK